MLTWLVTACTTLDLACIYLYLHVIVYYITYTCFILTWFIFSCFKLCICLMNMLFVRILREYCSFVIVLCKIWLTVPIHHHSGSVVCFFSLLPLSKEMFAPGQHYHFLSFCCGRCLRIYIKHLVRKSDVGSSYCTIFSTSPFVPLLCGTSRTSFETKVILSWVFAWCLNLLFYGFQF